MKRQHGEQVPVGLWANLLWQGGARIKRRVPSTGAATCRSCSHCYTNLTPATAKSLFADNIIEFDSSIRVEIFLIPWGRLSSIALSGGSSKQSVGPSRGVTATPSSFTFHTTKPLQVVARRAPWIGDNRNCRRYSVAALAERIKGEIWSIQNGYKWGIESS